MYFSEKHQIQWWLPVKTASRTTANILKKVNFSPFGSHHSFGLINCDWDLYVNVRNPYSAAVSYWLHQNSNRICNSDLGVSEFRKEIQSGLSYSKLYSHEFMWGWALHQMKIEPKFIRFENLKEDIFTLPFVQSKMKILTKELDEFDNIPNPYQMSRCEKLNVPYFEYYDSITAQIIYNKCYLEFEIGGYDKDSWKTIVK